MAKWKSMKSVPTDIPVLVTDGKTVALTNIRKWEEGNALGMVSYWMTSAGFDGQEWEYDMDFASLIGWQKAPAP